MNSSAGLVFFFFFNDRAPPEILPLPPPAPFPFFLVPADVARHGEPRRGALRVPRPVVELGGRVPEVIPGGIEERIGDVGLAPPLRAALRALGVVPLLVPRERADPARIGAEVLDERQQDGEVPLRHAHRTAAVAVNDGDRRAPGAPARDAPIAHAVPHLGGGPTPLP